VERSPTPYTLSGRPLTVIGRELRPGDVAPAFVLVNAAGRTADLTEYRLADSRGKVWILSAVPSVDTAT
jgi:thiol peroxidase